jgi:hypothetical protein
VPDMSAILCCTALIRKLIKAHRADPAAGRLGCITGRSPITRQVNYAIHYIFSLRYCPSYLHQATSRSILSCLVPLFRSQLESWSRTTVRTDLLQAPRTIHRRIRGVELASAMCLSVRISASELHWCAKFYRLCTCLRLSQIPQHILLWGRSDSVSYCSYKDFLPRLGKQQLGPVYQSCGAMLLHSDALLLLPGSTSANSYHLNSSDSSP